MAWIAVDKSGDVYIYAKKPYRIVDYWYIRDFAKLEDSQEAKYLTDGKVLTWDDEPLEI